MTAVAPKGPRPRLRPRRDREPDVQRRDRPHRRPPGSDVHPVDQPGPPDDRRLAGRPRPAERRGPRRVGDVADLDAGTHDVALRDLAQAGLTVLAISPTSVTRHGRVRGQRGAVLAVRRRLTVARLFGTDGIRGVANVDLKPTLAYALGRATAHRLVGRAARSSSARTRAGRATCSWPRSRPARRASASTSSRGVRPDAGPRVPRRDRRRSRPGSWSRRRTTRPTTTGSRSSTRQGLKLDDGIEDEIEQLIWRSEELARRRQRRDRPGRRRRRASSTATASTGSAWPGDRRRRACGSSSTARMAPAASSVRRSSPRPAPTVEVIHNEPDGININV